MIFGEAAGRHPVLPAPLGVGARILDALNARPAAFRSNDYLVQRAAIVAGLGAGVLSEHEARTLGLTRVPVPIELPAVALHLVVHRALRHAPRVAAVIEAIDTLMLEYER